MTTQAIAPGLEAKAQLLFEIPYAELSRRLQRAVRAEVLADAAEDMLEALKMAQKMVAQFIEDYESRKPHPSIAYSDAKAFDDVASAAIAKAEGR